MRIAVFCSARDAISAQYREDAETLARWIGANGHSLVYGGLDCGLMGVMGRCTAEAGGMVVGVVPQSRSEMQHADNTVNIYVNDLHERKAVMERESDVFVALAGGVGTVDEVMSVMVAAIFNRAPVSVYLLNRDGIYDGLLRMFDEMAARRLVTAEAVDTRLTVVDDIESLLYLLHDHACADD